MVLSLVCFGEMGDDNETDVTEFVLLGFSGFGFLQGHLFWGVLCIYVVTLLGNSLIVFLTLADSGLHSPMYFFLRHFSVVEILYTTTIVPRMLADLRSSCPTIPLGSCFTQLYFFSLFGVTECCLLTAMAYDRYAAICCPLHYATLMSQGTCTGMVGASYLAGFITGTTHSVCIFTLPFHGDNTIHHFLCDILPVLRLASANTFRGGSGEPLCHNHFHLHPLLIDCGLLCLYSCHHPWCCNIPGSSKALFYLFLPLVCGHSLFRYWDCGLYEASGRFLWGHRPDSYPVLHSCHPHVQPFCLFSEEPGGRRGHEAAHEEIP